MLSDRERIEQLERQLAELLRRIPQVECTPGSAPSLRRGWWLAVLTSSLSYNGTAAAEIVWRDAGQWKRNGHSIQVQGFWLNSDEQPIEPCTLIKAEWYGNCWVPTSIYCKVNNWLTGCTS